jgi:spore germination protein YaaH
MFLKSKIKALLQKLLLILGLFGFLGSTFSGGRSNFIVLGYHPYWMGNQWRNYDFNLFSDMVFFALYVESDGNFKSPNGWPLSWGELVVKAHEANIRIMPSITLLDSRKFDLVFSDAAAQIRLKRNIMDAVRFANADGVHLDFEAFEPVSALAKSNYTRFVQDIRQELNGFGSNKKLVVFTLALDPSSNYNERALSQSADYLVVQGFDLHWKDGNVAGPLSALNGWGQRNWNSILRRYDAKGVPHSKMIMSVPFYGYEWPTVSNTIGSSTRGKGETTSYSSRGSDLVATIRVNVKSRVAQFGSRRDATSGSPYYMYQNANGWHQGWYEDSISLGQKYEFIKRNRLAGVALFVPGYDNGELTAGVRRAFGSN